MMPIGLTFKNLKENPFTGKVSCELMVVHECMGCGKISKNRIAGDDYPPSIISLFNESLNIDTPTLNSLKCWGIELLSKDDADTVHTAIFGYR